MSGLAGRRYLAVLALTVHPTSPPDLKTAEALGLTIPPSLLLRADQVVE